MACELLLSHVFNSMPLVWLRPLLAWFLIIAFFIKPQNGCNT